MRFHIRHETRYEYAAAVEFGPQLLRLTPRDDGAQRVLRHDIAVDPLPARRSTFADAAGNVVTMLWFSGSTSSLVIVSEMDVETSRDNPFDFCPDPSFNSVPTFYPERLRELLVPYRDRSPGGDESIGQFSRAVLEDCDGTPMGFGLALSRVLCRDFDARIREGGAAQPPAQTLALRGGACRDLTMLFIAAARSLGLAARFVSGYRRGDTTRRDRHLHAWAEIYVECGGWRGFDPVEGLAVRDDHVAVASAPVQALTMPVEGFYAGPAGEATLHYAISIATG